MKNLDSDQKGWWLLLENGRGRRSLVSVKKKRPRHHAPKYNQGLGSATSSGGKLTFLSWVAKKNKTKESSKDEKGKEA